MRFSLKTLLIFVTVITLLLGGARELFRMRRSADHVPYHISFIPPGQFDVEQPVQLRPGVHRFVLPGLTEHLNSAACVDRMRRALEQYPVSKAWTIDNVAFSASSFAESGPSQMFVECQLLVPGHQEWSVAGSHSSGIDRKSLPEFEEKLQQFVVDEIDSYRRDLPKGKG